MRRRSIGEGFGETREEIQERSVWWDGQIHGCDNTRSNVSRYLPVAYMYCTVLPTEPKPLDGPTEEIGGGLVCRVLAETVSASTST